jgi:hypothetical protein
MLMAVIACEEIGREIARIAGENILRSPKGSEESTAV